MNDTALFCLVLFCFLFFLGLKAKPWVGLLFVLFCLVLFFFVWFVFVVVLPPVLEFVVTKCDAE